MEKSPGLPKTLCYIFEVLYSTVTIEKLFCVLVFGVLVFGVLVQFWKLSTFQTGGVKTNSDVVTAAKLVLVVDWWATTVGGRETFHKLLAPKLVGSGALLVLQSGNDKWSLGLQQLASLYSDGFPHK